MAKIHDDHRVVRVVEGVLSSWSAGELGRWATAFTCTASCLHITWYTPGSTLVREWNLTYCLEVKMHIERIIKDGTTAWQREQPAQDTVIERLVAELGFALPTDYVAFLKVSNGGEGELGIRRY